MTRDLLDELGLPGVDTLVPLEGLGGRFRTVDVAVEIRFKRDDGGEVVIRNRRAAVTDPDALEMSILGRDILDLFALILRSTWKYRLLRRPAASLWHRRELTALGPSGGHRAAIERRRAGA